MNNDKTVSILNSLVEINNDRIEGYETASKETKELELIALFAQFTETSFACKNELEQEVITLGGEPAEGTKVSGKFFRAWMEVKAALSSNDRKAVLNSCEFGEDAALAEYKKVMENEVENLSVEQLAMIRAQYNNLKADHDKVKALRDAANAVS